MVSAIAAALAWVILIGCGDVYRPVANPVLKPGGDPQALRIALVLSNSSGAPGMATAVDVSGDTNIGNFVIGRGAVQAAFKGSASLALVANKGDDTVSLLAPNTQGSTVTTITLPAGSAPVFVGSTEGSIVYVANSGTNSIGGINLSSAIQQSSFPVGPTPVALAETPDATRLYSVNQGNGTVTAIDPRSGAVLDPAIPVGASPVAAAINSTGSTLYVLNQGSGSVSVIDTASNTITATVSTGASPRFLSYDSHLRRLYVANTGSNTISVFSADVGLTPLATVTVGAGPASIAPLPDGTRVYVANAGCSDAVNLAGCSGNTVTVVDALSFAVRKTITVGSAPVSLAADAASTKVVVANRDSDSISAIRTSDDTIINTIASAAPKPLFVTVSP
ncbi:MAG: beta-propeller fold lactonase family protein [Terriglobales bacterium]